MLASLSYHLCLGARFDLPWRWHHLQQLSPGQSTRRWRTFPGDGICRTGESLLGCPRIPSSLADRPGQRSRSRLGREHGPLFFFALSGFTELCLGAILALGAAEGLKYQQAMPRNSLQIDLHDEAVRDCPKAPVGRGRDAGYKADSRRPSLLVDGILIVSFHVRGIFTGQHGL